ncbi:MULTISPECIES: TetR/AcrR family transcriptional regulator [Paracoccus]|uniref:TetR family transcriptional regulator n=2 Tax=Paracoccus TaxID=265 RepID=A0A6L6JDR5_9RHOB|nr:MULTISPECIES: TetR/AcrR family transcriptional regulator [Paracoccus]MDS9469640.1 TetR/AcrR family transcriptional regulator [Paracoccus sp. MBLB3053]MTH80303.1 TetR family transcriptional regulator [Paracoccus aestuariivivens]
MARPREFNEDEALLQATRLFWSKGYEGTSMSDLLRVTGLSKSSLYDTFGSKRALFLAAFEAYRLERMRVMRGYLQSGTTAYDAIAAFFAMVLEHARAADRPFGCMSCNEAAEMAPHDEEVQNLIERDFDGMETAFAEAIERGHGDGSIPLENDARQFARFLNATHHGIQILARTKGNVERMDDAVTVTLRALRSVG